MPSLPSRGRRLVGGGSLRDLLSTGLRRRSSLGRIRGLTLRITLLELPVCILVDNELPVCDLGVGFLLGASLWS